jgi:putative addiction module component (TIGR02574 family)
MPREPRRVCGTAFFESPDPALILASSQGVHSRKSDRYDSAGAICRIGNLMHTEDLVALPLAERLQAMKALWESLCRDTPAELLVPAWHAAELSARAQALDSGKEAVSDWPDAKQRIRGKVGIS